MLFETYNVFLKVLGSRASLAVPTLKNLDGGIPPRQNLENSVTEELQSCLLLKKNSQ